MRSWLVGALAVSIALTPAGATAASGAPVPVLPGQEQVGGNGESAADDDDDNTVWYIAGGVALAILLILLLSGGGDDDVELPVSP